MLCACGSKRSFHACCEPYLTGQKLPDVPEQLMRSRYTAYTKGDVGYIAKTMQGKAAVGFDAVEARVWASRVSWIDLRVLQTSWGDEHTGFVEFIARFIDDSKLISLHETSEFVREDGRWFYIDGAQVPHAAEKIARNSACPCQSGKKFKQCHGKA